MTRRITEADVLAEIDRLFSADAPTLVPTGGFTVNDVMSRTGLCTTSARRRIAKLLQDGQIQQIGVRPRTHSVVYDVVKQE